MIPWLSDAAGQGIVSDLRDLKKVTARNRSWQGWTQTFGFITPEDAAAQIPLRLLYT